MKLSLKSAINKRFTINKYEKRFLYKIQTAVKQLNSSSSSNIRNKDYFFAEAVSVEQWRCLSQGLFAKRGELEGYTPVIIMSNFVRKNKKVFSSLNISHIELMLQNINLFDYIKSFLWAIEKYRNIRTPEDLINVSYNGIKVGDCIYSSYLSRYMTGTIFKITPKIIPYLMSCYYYYIYYEKLFKKYNPKFVILTDNTYIPCGILFRMAIQKGLPAYTVVWPSSNNVAIKKFDKKSDIGDVSILNPTKIEWITIHKKRQKELIDSGKNWMERRFRGEDSSFGGADTAGGRPEISKKEIYELLNIDGTKKVILICSHVMWDDPIIYTSLYRDYYCWLVETAKIANDIEDVIWVVKAHPGEMDTLGRTTDQIPIRAIDILKTMSLKSHIRYLDSGLKFNNYSLMQVVDAVVTVRGTIGVEYASIGTPVIAAGTGAYTCADIAITCKTIEEYKERLKNIGKLEKLSSDTIERAHLFAYFYFAGGTSIKVSGTPDGFDVRNLKDSFFKDFLSDDNWSKIMRNMIDGKDCRKFL